MTKQSFNVLFLCTGNSARSVLAEAILNKIGENKFHAYSAGSQPKSKINSGTIKLLNGLGYDTSNYYSKSWDEFTKSDAPKFDFIFTVCDDAAGETCPVWPGKPATAHWGIADPAAVTGNEVEVAQAFQMAYRYLHNRISLFTALPFDSLDQMSLTSKLKEIGSLEGATGKAKHE